MRKKEAGQAFILVLILLAIGALTVVPALRLTGTSLKSSQIATRQVKNLYAADAAQEWVLWQLKQPDFANSLEEDVPHTLEFDACGVLVTATIIMRAVEGTGGLILATDDVIRPTKTVDCGGLGDTIDNDWGGTVTYTIRLEQLSGNTTQGLDAVYDILPKTFDESEYVLGSSELRVDGGTWGQIDDPYWDVVGGQVWLRWPGDASGFTQWPGAGDNFITPVRDFTPRQVKELRFQMTHTFSGVDKNKAYPNWVVLKPWNTLSGPQAVITVGDPDPPNVYADDGLLYTTKTADPEIIPPGIETDIKYTIIVTNQDSETHHIQEIRDYLPPGFQYIGPTSNMTTDDPISENVTINGVVRPKLLWTTDEFPNNNAVSIASGETLYLVFWAKTTKDISGLYYNEAMVLPQKPIPMIFSDLGISMEDFNTTYSWNSGAVMVPAYDTETDADGTIIDANMSFTIEGITITSYQFR